MKLEQQQQQNWIFSPAFVFFLAAFLLFGSIASLYAWLVFTPFVRTPYVVPSLGCQEDNEGSWSIGVFYGTSPFSLSPIEDRNVWKNESVACPVANPVITCASVSEAGYPSNFVADPFLYIRETAGVADIQDKMMENKLRWFGHVRRRPIDHPVKKVENWNVGECKRSRGRPKIT